MIRTGGGDWGPGRTPCSASSFSGKADIHCPGTKTRPRRSAPSDACATRRGMCVAPAGGPLSFAGKKPCDLYPKGHFCATPSSVLALRESSAWRPHLLALKCHQRQATQCLVMCTSESANPDEANTEGARKTKCMLKTRY